MIHSNVFFFSLIHLVSFYKDLTGKLILSERLDGNQNSRSEELRGSRVDFTSPWRIFMEKMELETILYYLHEFHRKVAAVAPEFLIVVRSFGGRDA